jgi:hypothetical protein
MASSLMDFPAFRDEVERLFKQWKDDWREGWTDGWRDGVREGRHAGHIECITGVLKARFRTVPDRFRIDLMALTDEDQLRGYPGRFPGVFLG